VARLDDVTPANMALQLQINVSLNRPPDRTWRRSPGRPRNKWLDQLQNDSTCPTGDLWRCAADPTVDMVVQRRDGPRQLHDHDDDDDWHQLDNMQTISTLLQTDNCTNTPSLNFYRPDALPDAQPTVSKH